jgi:hypothetical protein
LQTLSVFDGSCSGVWNADTLNTMQSQQFWQSTGLSVSLPQNQNPAAQTMIAEKQYQNGPGFTVSWYLVGSDNSNIYEGADSFLTPLMSAATQKNSFAKSCPTMPTINANTVCESLYPAGPERSSCLKELKKLKSPKSSCQPLPSL